MTHRRGQRDLDERTQEALECAQRDPELRQWVAAQQEFNETVTETLRTIPVPEGLRERLLQQRKIVRIPWWRQRAVLAAAAAVAVLVTFLVIPMKRDSEAAFATYRARMVGTVVRQYAMDLVTNDMTVIQHFLEQQRAPADYTLPAGLAKLPPMGAGILSWQGRRVSMVCLNGGKQGTLFLFVADAKTVAQAPTDRPSFEQVSALGTVSWQQGGKLYVLAAHAHSEALRQYL
jgi:hypothetical protein